MKNLPAILLLLGMGLSAHAQPLCNPLPAPPEPAMMSVEFCPSEDMTFFLSTPFGDYVTEVGFGEQANTEGTFPDGPVILPAPEEPGPYTYYFRFYEQTEDCATTWSSPVNITVLSSGCPGQPVIDPFPSTLAAGNPAGVKGSTDGTSSTASFFGLQGVAFQSSTGFHLLADAFNHTIRSLSPSEAVSTVSGAAGSTGFVDGSFTEARFNLPAGMAFDGTNQNLFVADKGNHAIRMLDFTTNEVFTIAGGGAPGYRDGDISQALFNSPTDVAVVTGGLLVVDHGNHCVRAISFLTNEVFTLVGNGTPGFANGPGTDARLNSPWAIVVVSDELFYVTDYGNHCIRMVSEGNATVASGAAGQAGYVDGVGTEVRYNRPTGICLQSTNLIITDHNNRAVRRFDTMSSTTVTLSGNGMPGNAVGSQARYLSPVAIDVGTAGSLIVLDAFSHQVRKLAP